MPQDDSGARRTRRPGCRIGVRPVSNSATPPTRPAKARALHGSAEGAVGAAAVMIMGASLVAAHTEGGLPRH